MYESIVKGENLSSPGIPESFNVLMQELRGLCLDINIYDVNNTKIELSDREGSGIKKRAMA